MAIDWRSLGHVVAQTVGQAVSQVGKKAVEKAFDSALEDLDGALKEGRKRIKAARGRVQKEPATEEPEGVVIDATLEDE